VNADGMIMRRRRKLSALFARFSIFCGMKEMSAFWRHGKLDKKNRNKERGNKGLRD
jgi:hypothetical protein